MEVIYVIDNRKTDIDWEADGVDAILQRAKNIMMTMRGEVKYDAMRGIDPELLAKPVNYVNDRIASALDEALKNDGDMNVRWARCEPDENGGLIITAGIEIADGMIE